MPTPGRYAFRLGHVELGAIYGDFFLTHDQPKAQRQRSPILRKEEGGGWLSEGTRGIRLNQAVNAHQNHDYSVSAHSFWLQERRRHLLAVHEKMPKTLVTLRNLSGRKFNGTNISPQMIFH